MSRDGNRSQVVVVPRFGPPAEVLEVVPLDEPGRPGPGQVSVELLYAPIHPSDLLFIRGVYGIRPTLPATPGQEGAARVTAVGDGVDHLATGDLVLVPHKHGTWRDRSVLDAAALFALPPAVDPQQAAVLSANPLSADLLLSEFAELSAGDWVVQNAATSAVGSCVIDIARSRGLRTVNVVRREGAVDEILARGGDVVLVDGPDLGHRVRESTRGDAIQIGLDAVGGKALANMMGAVAPGATIVIYGAVGGAEFVGPAGLLIFAGLTLRSFWLVSWLKRIDRDELIRRQRHLVTLHEQGSLRTKIAGVHPLAKAADAAAEAAATRGKVLLAGSAVAG